MKTRTDILDRVLLTGASGMLAAALTRALKRRGVEPILCDRARCDLTDADAVARLLPEEKPTLVLNAAAYTAVDKAEAEEEQATRVNGDAPGHLAAACAKCGATLVHFSTDFVFDGRGTTPYAVDAPVAPVSAYGRSKLAGERAIEASPLDDYLVLRTAWLYGPWVGRPFPKLMVDLARNGTPLKVVNDQRGAPTMTVDLAEAALDLAAGGHRGVFHVTNGGETTWHDFAKASLDAFGLADADLQPTTTAAYTAGKTGIAPRPAYSALDLAKTEAALGRPMRPWQRALLDYRDLCAAA